MKVLILTSLPFFAFVWGETRKYPEHTFLVRDAKPYDWSEDYDVGISFMYTYKIPAEQLSKTWINFHPGPLPEYKGRNLCYHALVNGETEFGATVHYIDEHFDTGDIIDVRRFPIRMRWCADDLSQETFIVSMDLFGEYLPRILDGENFLYIHNEGGTYYLKEKIDEFIYPPEDIKNQIRAISYNDFVPKINIGGRIFKVVRE